LFLFAYIYEKRHERLCDVRCIKYLFISRHHINLVRANTSADKKKKKKESEKNDSSLDCLNIMVFSFSFSSCMVLADGQSVWQ
jgi:hypothetical protein